jgi:adenine deaminase
MKELLKAARKEGTADLLLKNARVANLFTMEFEDTDVAVKDGVIVGVGSGYSAREEIDCGGRLLVPGFIEGHMHIESTYMVPRNFAAAAAPHGTTTVMADPHEIANTCGMEGVRFMHEESKDLPVDIFYGAPSCVPASYFETPREPLGAEDIKTLLDEGTCTHLGELMNFVGACDGADDVMAKVKAAAGKVVTGHAPGVTGASLAAYIISGATSDHECATAEEAIEKLRRGMYVMLRQGTATRDLAKLAPIVRDDPRLCVRCMAVSDDISPAFMKERGHLDGCLRELIEAGVDEMAALRMVTLTPAEYFRLNDRGAIAPGRIADMVLLSGSLKECEAEKTWKRGVMTVSGGKLINEITPAVLSPLPGNRKTVQTPTAAELEVRMPSGIAKLRVIGTLKDSVVTETLEIEPTVRDGLVVADASRSIAKMAVVEKNRGTGRTAIGFIKDLGIMTGAIASSVAHDAHNFTCVGMDDESMAAALSRLSEMGGGIVAAEDGEVIFSRALPVGGLMSLLPFEELVEAFVPLDDAIAHLGCSDKSSLMRLSFMSLSVIPALKLTDRGYFDISDGGPKELFVK